MLRLRDGETEIAYAIAEALDIVALPEPLVPATAPGPAAGVVALDGDQVELIDLIWLFAEHGEADHGVSPLVCLLDGEDAGWMMTFLKPMLEAAGYRVVGAGGDVRDADIVLTSADTGTAAASPPATPVVRLRRRKSPHDAADDSIYRYDRDGVLAALARAGGRA